MARAKRGFKARQRRKKVLGLAKGFRGSRNSRFKTAVHVVKRALAFSYRDRKVKKREFRRLWTLRINAASRELGLKYSDLICGLKRASVVIDRSVLADLAVNEPDAFSALVTKAKLALAK